MAALARCRETVLIGLKMTFHRYTMRMRDLLFMLGHSKLLGYHEHAFRMTF
jgi:hypothetical protein